MRIISGGLATKPIVVRDLDDDPAAAEADDLHLLPLETAARGDPPSDDGSLPEILERLFFPYGLPFDRDR